MNHIPPNEPNESDRDEPGFVRRQSGNPYEGRQAADTPDLDANAPYLNSADVQRMNRKALAFLGGIVLLLGMVAIWIFSGGLSGPEEQVQRAPRSEQVVIPAAPDLPDLPPERPMPPPMADLPPLPVIDDTPPPPSSSMMGGLTQGSFGRQDLSLLERRLSDSPGGLVSGGTAEMGGGQGQGDFGGMLGMQGQPSTASQGPVDGPTSARPLYNPDTLLLRGTYIRCVLQSRVITDFPGYTSCVVTEPVYSVNGRRLLLPRGSKVLGSYGSDSITGDRAAIVWDRITTPNGLDINMRSPGVDMLGSAGNAGHYTAHWGQRIGSALLISMLSDAFKYAGAKHGPQETSFGNGFVVQSPYESNTARTMERLANLALERNMTRPPTVTINQGTIVNVYVARDVDFTAVMR